MKNLVTHFKKLVESKKEQQKWDLMFMRVVILIKTIHWQSVRHINQKKEKLLLYYANGLVLEIK